MFDSASLTNFWNGAALRELPFVSSDADGALCFWDPSDEFDPEDMEGGELCARLALHIARHFGMPLLIAMILRDMVTKSNGNFTRLEAGFIVGITSAAMVGNLN